MMLTPRNRGIRGLRFSGKWNEGVQEVKEEAMQYFAERSAEVEGFRGLLPEILK